MMRVLGQFQPFQPGKLAELPQGGIADAGAVEIQGDELVEPRAGRSRRR